MKRVVKELRILLITLWERRSPPWLGHKRKSGQVLLGGPVQVTLSCRVKLVCPSSRPVLAGNPCTQPQRLIWGVQDKPTEATTGNQWLWAILSALCTRLVFVHMRRGYWDKTSLISLGKCLYKPKCHMTSTQSSTTMTPASWIS